MVFYLYVVDDRRHLVGVVSLRRLLLVPPDTPLKRIMTTEVYSVRVDTDQEEVARQVASYNLLAIPVVDAENKLVGVITVDDVIDVIKDEATEDVYRLAGVSKDDGVLTPPGESLRRRLPWLLVNLVTAFIAASVVGLFSGDDQTGRGPGRVHAGRRRHGRQRGHADAGGHRARHRARRADLEQRPAGADQGRPGRAGQRARQRALVGAVGVWVITRGDWALGLILMAAMVINMFVAATAGTLIPLGLRALKVDPALASSVFITTFTDVFGFFSFLGLAHDLPAVPASARVSALNRVSAQLDMHWQDTGQRRKPVCVRLRADASLYRRRARPSDLSLRRGGPHRRLPDRGPRQEARRGEERDRVAAAVRRRRSSR